ncbi:cobyric acid synthase [Aliidongia dinghuensis]|uniref:Cobyric acid synthase n=1 Tax=Aliidongia dinghuensis TaxID=1867774 RepID=A0A8J2YQ64_9PROT|nr:cobyric acid synthase [Aliidongia dinghuensis]GGF02638.1 cobyric acid synthase [Aliidongia dinghuensis]
MFQGTGSDVGKSLLVAGLGRAFTRRGLRVLPFKPQNMSNNAAVTADGGEIGRAQALQARACGVEPGIDMNPVLLKPHSETGAQIIVQGRVWRDAEARRYQALKPELMPFVLESFDRLAARADLVLIEGAGSPAEVNLRAGDIANMGFAEAADVPVVLIGDIDRGGVIASIVGTQALLEPAERARLKGYLINKFRGDVGLFGSAVDILKARTGLDCLGIVPHWAEAAKLPAEDAVALDQSLGIREGGAFRVVVPRLPNISNFDDLDPLSAEPGVSVEFVAPGRPLPRDADLVLLPGSKATRADLAALRAQGWDIDLLAHARAGGRVLGLCGGYQILGRSIVDPTGMEGPAGESAGLGLLDVTTVLHAHKTLTRLDVRDDLTGEQLQAYEIHVGETDGPGRTQPFLVLDGRPEGAVSADGRIAGCYLHGLFTADGWRRRFLGDVGAATDPTLGFEAMVGRTLDRLADHLETVIDLDRLLEIARAR